MANEYLNIAEAAKRRGPQGNVATIAELFTQINDILKDGPMVMANDIYSHWETVRTKLPTVAPRLINQGAARSASKTKQVQESIMLLEVFADMDEQAIDHEPDKQKALRNELQPFFEAMLQEFTRIFFYGNPGVDSAECLGLATRYNLLADTNVWAVGAGSGSDQTSVWMIEWGEMKFKLIYPRDSKSVGIQDEDLGKIRSYDSSTNPLMVYSHQIKAEFGWSLVNAKAVQRLCNIDTTTLGTNDLLASNAMRKMIIAKNQLPLFGKNAVIYCNRTTKTQFDIWATEKSNGFYLMKNITGEPLTVFQAIPVHMAEQITDLEDLVA